LIINIFTSRNFVHLNAVFEEFYLQNNNTIEKMIRNIFSGSTRDALLAIYQFTTDSDGFFADCLYNSMIGLGTRDRALIRLVVTRAEIDMANIKVAFINKYLKTLESFIEVIFFISVKYLF
jgi:annexin A7/11